MDPGPNRARFLPGPKLGPVPNRDPAQFGTRPNLGPGPIWDPAQFGTGNFTEVSEAP